MSTTEKEICLSCQGSGKCSKCEGTGNVMREVHAPMSVISGRSDQTASSVRTCPRCYGSGTCQTCKGSGKKA
jgi:hypothetical protein